MKVSFKTENGAILFVRVPDDATIFEVSMIGNCFCYSLDGIPQTLDLDGYNWQLIGLTSEITEEQAKMMVDDEYDWHFNTGFVDYTNIATVCGLSAIESFKSLMQHLQVYEVNPINPPIERLQYGGGYAMRQSEIDVYEQAESRTGKWIVLFKPN